MKIVIAVLALMPSLVSAQSNSAVYRPLPDARCGYVDCIPPEPQPWPKPRPKPCKPWEGCDDAIVPLSNLESKAAGLTTAIADGKFDQAGAGLDGFYAGSVSKEKGSSSAVGIGGWTVEPRASRAVGLSAASSRLRGRKKAVPAPGFLKVACGDKDGCKSETGKIVEDAVGGLLKPIEKWVDRDRTQDSRDTYGGCRMKGTCPK